MPPKLNKKRISCIIDLVEMFSHKGVPNMIETEMDKLRKVGISPNKLKQYQVLCLPENCERAATADELFDASGVANLSKRLKVAGLKCANSFDLGLEAGVLDRRAADLWLGLVWIMDRFAIPVFVGVASAVLTSMIHGRSKSSPSTIQRPRPKVHLTLRLLRGDDLTTIDYDGDPETLKQLLSGIRVGADPKE